MSLVDVEMINKISLLYLYFNYFKNTKLNIFVSVLYITFRIFIIQFWKYHLHVSFSPLLKKKIHMFVVLSLPKERLWTTFDFKDKLKRRLLDILNKKNMILRLPVKLM